VTAAASAIATSGAGAEFALFDLRLCPDWERLLEDAAAARAPAR
jgi:hypothetical protein